MGLFTPPKITFSPGSLICSITKAVYWSVDLPYILQYNCTRLTCVVFLTYKCNGDLFVSSFYKSFRIPRKAHGP